MTSNPEAPLNSTDGPSNAGAALSVSPLATPVPDGQLRTHQAPHLRRGTVPLVLAAVVTSVLASGGLLVWHAEAKTNKVALASTAKPVTVITARAKDYRPSRAYVGTLQPWVSANLGPQLVSAFIDTVLVRPGASVKRGEVLATLDCRDASAANRAVAMEARAIDARQRALAAESARLSTLLAGNFVSPNEAEQKAALSSAEAAHLGATQAQLMRQSLEVNDCILRAPFDGEVATRNIDPGAFVRPGASIVSLVDRSTLRYTTDVPEIDFEVVAPGRSIQIHISATNTFLVGTISRRAPAADPGTRTVHFEVDLPDPARTIPVGTTGEALLSVGEPVPATEIPIYAAKVRGTKATVFVVDQGVARARTVEIKGEIGGSLYVDADLTPGSLIVTEGRAALQDGDHVQATLEESLLEVRR